MRSNFSGQLIVLIGYRIRGYESHGPLREIVHSSENYLFIFDDGTKVYDIHLVPVGDDGHEHLLTVAATATPHPGKATTEVIPDSRHPVWRDMTTQEDKPLEVMIAPEATRG